MMMCGHTTEVKRKILKRAQIPQVITRMRETDFTGAAIQLIGLGTRLQSAYVAKSGESQYSLRTAVCKRRKNSSCVKDLRKCVEIVMGIEMLKTTSHYNY